MRTFNTKAIELLAPCGNYEIFLELLDTGADAFYLGGKQFNMRMHRQDFNFSNDDLVRAITLAHQRGKKIYVTLNNMLDEHDLRQLDDYLYLLEAIKPDALIVQDLAVMKRIQDLHLTLEVHASVMMNVHNTHMIEHLKTLGVTRVVVSRDVSLADVKNFSGIELEYFIHGDMCAVHGSQCHYSGILFGKSSNRGLCMKPCRWHFDIETQKEQVNTTYPMAVKDMYMYEHIPELIDAGVVSFKIEGRMRDAAYLSHIIHAYSDAIDRYLYDPIAYCRHKDASSLYEHRKRDFSTARAFGNPGLSYINERYEGTGKFYSTGKPFSHPIPEWSIAEEPISTFSLPHVASKTPKLSVRVNDLEQAYLAIASGADRIYLSMEPLKAVALPTRDDILRLVKNKHHCDIYLALPRMASDTLMSQYIHYFEHDDMGIDGVLLSHFGWLHALKAFSFKKIVDYTQNLYNLTAHDYCLSQGAHEVTASIEFKQEAFQSYLSKKRETHEVIVHGLPTVMYMDQCLFENLSDSSTHTLQLLDEKGVRHPVFKDIYGKNHFMLAKPICLLPIFDTLKDHVATVRIEGSPYPNDVLKSLVTSYRALLDGNVSSHHLIEDFIADCSLGALHFT